MHNQKYKLTLSGETIDGRVESCTGPQLVRVLSTIKSELLEATWFVVDVRMLGKIGIELFVKNSIQKPKKIGATEELITFSKNIEQFESGIFLCVLNKDIIALTTGAYDTEDTKDYLDPAILEIRAFDTTYYEIFTSIKECAKKIGTNFNVQFTTI